jgi:hypothetical protein
VGIRQSCGGTAVQPPYREHNEPEGDERQQRKRVLPYCPQNADGHPGSAPPDKQPVPQAKAHQQESGKEHQHPQLLTFGAAEDHAQITQREQARG